MIRSGLRALVTITLMNSLSRSSDGPVRLVRCTRVVKEKVELPAGQAVVQHGDLEGAGHVDQLDLQLRAGYRSDSSWSAVLPVARTVAVTCQPASTHFSARARPSPREAPKRRLVRQRCEAELRAGLLVTVIVTIIYHVSYRVSRRSPARTLCARSEVRRRRTRRSLVTMSSPRRLRRFTRAGVVALHRRPASKRAKHRCTWWRVTDVESSQLLRSFGATWLTRELSWCRNRESIFHDPKVGGSNPPPPAGAVLIGVSRSSRMGRSLRHGWKVGPMQVFFIPPQVSLRGGIGRRLSDLASGVRRWSWNAPAP